MAIPHLKTLFRSVTQRVHEFFVRSEFDAQTSNWISELRLSTLPEAEKKRIREFLDRLEKTEAMSLENYVGMMRDPVTGRYWDFCTKQQGHGMWDEYHAVENSVAENRLGDADELERFKREGYQYIKFEGIGEKHLDEHHREILNRLEETEAMSLSRNVGLMHDPASNRYWELKKQNDYLNHGMRYEYEVVDTSEAESLLGDPEKLEAYRSEGRRSI